MLVGYALWVIAQARRHGVRRIYFVSRDGELMMRAAAPILDRLAPELELRYLYGSRQPWRLAAGARSDSALASWLQVTSDFTARTMLARVELTPEQVNELAGATVVAPSDTDTPLSVERREQIATALLRPPLLDAARSRAIAAEQSLLAYLRQEGLLDGVPAAVVDAGWNGTTAQALDVALLGAGGDRVEHLLLGLTDNASAVRRDGVHLSAWLADATRNPDVFRGFPGMNVLVEMFCAGSEGRLLRYHVGAGGVVVPELREPANAAPLGWGLREMQSAAVRVAELVAPSLGDASLHVDLTALVWDVLRAFWLAPTATEARAWGSFPWEEETATPFSPVAEPVSAAAVVRRWRDGEPGLRRLNSWRAGSAVVSRQPWRSLLQLRAVQERYEQRLRRLPRRLRLEIARRKPR
jgi:hypothetical protein